MVVLGKRAVEGRRAGEGIDNLLAVAGFKQMGLQSGGGEKESQARKKRRRVLEKLKKLNDCLRFKTRSKHIKLPLVNCFHRFSPFNCCLSVVL